MKLLPSEREQVLAVAGRWKNQYCHNGVWGGCKGDPRAIYQCLKALPANATAADVAKIIGNDSWVCGMRCDECGDMTAQVQVGDEPDYESNTVNLCFACIRRLALIEQPQSAVAVVPGSGGSNA